MIALEVVQKLFSDVLANQKPGTSLQWRRQTWAAGGAKPGGWGQDTPGGVQGPSPGNGLGQSSQKLTHAYDFIVAKVRYFTRFSFATPPVFFRAHFLIGFVKISGSSLAPVGGAATSICLSSRPNKLVRLHSGYNTDFFSTVITSCAGGRHNMSPPPAS